VVSVSVSWVARSGTAWRWPRLSSIGARLVTGTWSVTMENPFHARPTPRPDVKVDAEAQHSRPVVRAKLRNERREDPRKDVPRAAFRQASVACRADEDLSVRRNHDRVITLENKVCVPSVVRHQAPLQGGRPDGLG